MNTFYIPELNSAQKTSSQPLTEELVAEAIAGIIGAAKANGRSLTDLTEEVLMDDHVLDNSTRHWLSDIVSQAWTLPETLESQEINGVSD